ncbi:MAG: GNAT family N-acetyltransferase [Chloroflexia bacterium]|nr:GNAT family N-acetyltransferase [Chloroflexia bacterium]
MSRAKGYRVIHELPRERFSAAAPLFAPIWFDEAQIGAALSGRQPGRLFVDDPQRPRAALLCRTYGFYPAGDPHSSTLRAFIAGAPAEAAVFDTLFGYMVDDAWREALLHDHGDDLTVIGREAFHFLNEASTQVIDPPADVRLLPLDAALAKRVDDELGQMIGAFWGGYAAFAAGGFGTCALIDDRVAGVAYAIAVSDRTANIDIETAVPFRRRGLATLTAAAFVAACQERGLTATWGCDTANEASAALAHRLGFVQDAPHAQLSPRPGIARVRTKGVWSQRESDKSQTLQRYARI